MSKNLLLPLLMSFFFIGCSASHFKQKSQVVGLEANQSEPIVILSDLEEYSIEDYNSLKVIPLDEEMPQEVNYSDYLVQNNDTLMLISWKIYGSISHWRELLELNSDKIKNHTIHAGDTIKFRVPKSSFSNMASGRPYLIKKNDTLSGISYKVYDTVKYWRDIWDNNRGIIRDPNLLFAGFTIYYKELEKIESEEIALSKLKSKNKKRQL